MSWASRRRATYISGFVLFCIALFGVPLFLWLDTPATCFNGTQDGGETAIDKGGPCVLLDERMLSPYSVDWARGFPLRSGQYTAAAYIQNPNKNAGVIAAPYRFRLYDENNIEVATREGTTFVMPGSITPVFEGSIETGNRTVARTFFEFTAPLVWERVRDDSNLIRISDKRLTSPEQNPRATAVAANGSVKDMRKVVFVAIVFDTAGNAMASSRTEVDMVRAGKRVDITFTWPDSFPRPVGNFDIIPLLAPVRS